MKILCLVLVLMVLLTSVAFAIKNPVDYAGDTIRKNTNSAVDDAMSKIKIGTNEIMEGIKTKIKNTVSFFLEIFTVVAIAWLFTFLVSKTTARMVKFLAIVLGVTQAIKIFI